MFLATKPENVLVLKLYHNYTTHDRTAAVVAHTGYSEGIPFGTFFKMELTINLNVL